MKKFTLALTALCLAAAMTLTGCLPLGTQADDAVSAREAAALDPLTGELARWPGQRPASVFVYNGMDAGRQWGIGEASVVFEALTEGESSTSLCLAYPSLEAVPKVGPVAQAQDLYLQLLICQQAIPVQRGASIYAANFLDCYQISPLDALSLGVKGFNYEGVWGQPDQISWTTSGASLTPLAASAGVSLEPQAAAAAASADSEAEADEGIRLPPLLPFGEPAGGKEGASSVEVIFSADASTSFTYDAGTGHYLMARADGTPQTDANTGAQAGFDNLLILYSAPPGRRLFLGVRPDYGRGGLPERRLGLEHPLDARGRFHPGHLQLGRHRPGDPPRHQLHCPDGQRSRPGSGPAGQRRRRDQRQLSAPPAVPASKKSPGCTHMSYGRDFLVHSY